jgi:hypothetical protein
VVSDAVNVVTIDLGSIVADLIVDAFIVTADFEVVVVDGYAVELFVVQPTS